MSQLSTQSSKPTPSEIAERAYFLYEKEGRIDGSDMDNWLRAESQLTRERQTSQAARDSSNQPRAAVQDRRASKSVPKISEASARQATPMARRAAV